MPRRKVPVLLPFLASVLVGSVQWLYQIHIIPDCSFGTATISADLPFDKQQQPPKILKEQFSFRSLTPVDCDVVRETYPDPNDGKIFLRTLTVKPPFAISVHTVEFDSLRWNSLFERAHYYEHEVHARFEKILRDSLIHKSTPNSTYDQQRRKVVIDVGANIGYYSLLTASILRHEPVDIISFEPNPANVMRLCESIQFNDNIFSSSSSSPTIHILLHGAGHKHGERLRLVVPSNPGEGRLKAIENGTLGSSNMTTTTIVTLDQLAKDQGWLTVGGMLTPQHPMIQIPLLKIDVEGSEPKVIQGATSLIQAGIIDNILMEGRRFQRPAMQEILLTLFQAGYALREPFIDDAHQTPEEQVQDTIDMWKRKVPTGFGTIDLWFVRRRRTVR